MVVLTIKVTEMDLEQIDKAVKSGNGLNRSDFIKRAMIEKLNTINNNTKGAAA